MIESDPRITRFAINWGYDDDIVADAGDAAMEGINETGLDNENKENEDHMETRGDVGDKSDIATDATTPADLVAL